MGCGQAMAEFEGPFCFVAGGEGDVLEVSVRVCDLYVLLDLCIMKMCGLWIWVECVLTCSPVSLFKLLAFDL